MSALAEAVHHGKDGSIHYLASSATGSQLIITDPVLGVRRQSFDGPVVLVSNEGFAEYEPIDSTGSTTVIVNPGLEPNITWVGICTYCAMPPIGQAGRGHDFQLWPYCPWAEKGPAEAESVVPLPARSEPVAEPAPRSSAGTGDAQAVPAQGTQGAPRVRVVGVDPQYTPAPEEPVTPPEIRWGGPAGGW